MMRLQRVISLGVVALIGVGITVWFVSRSNVPGVSGAFTSGNETSWMAIALAAAYGFVITVVGVGLGALYRRLVKLRAAGVESIKPGELLRSILPSVDFQIGLVGAPVIYGLLWQSLSDISLAGLTIIALQNGFASHAVLDQIVREKPDHPNAPAAVA
jgi:hypothetical protein